MEKLWSSMVIDGVWMPVVMLAAGSLNLLLIGLIMRTAQPEQQSMAQSQVWDRIIARKKSAWVFALVGALWLLQELFI